MMKTSDTKDSAFFLDMVQTPLFDTTFDLRDGDVITIDQDDTVVAALRTLCESDILSAPVVDVAGDYVGMLDMMALVTCSLNIFDQAWRPLRDSDNYLTKKRRFRRTLVREVMNRRSFGLKKNNPILEDFSLFHAMETMCLTGEHRLAVVDSDNFVTGLINQSMLVNWLVRNLERMPLSLRRAKTVEIRRWNVVSTLPVSSRAIEAFRMMTVENVSAVGIIDESDRLVDVISARDLRGMSPDSLTFRFLWNTCDYFKDQVRESYPRAPKKPIVVTRNADLEKILAVMTDNHIHRVFVVDSMSSNKPVDVISMTDCLRYIADTIKDQSVV